MGDISDMIIEGILDGNYCRICEDIIDYEGGGVGYPTICDACSQESESE